MAVDLVTFQRVDDHAAIHEAASAGLQSLQHLISIFQSQSQQQQQSQLDCRDLTDFTVSKFKKVVSILNRTGHARFRRGPANSPSTRSPPPCSTSSYSQPEPQKPVQVLPARPVQAMTLDFTKPSSKESLSFCTPMSSASGSFVSSVTGDGSVSNGKLGLSASVIPAPAFSAGKPPLPATHKKKRCREHGSPDETVGKHSSSHNGCHCSKRRKSRGNRVIKRVPAMSPKFAEIPPDEYTWRKYGQKPIKGSPFPRGYYKCSSVRGCPARKHVERDQNDPTMLIVTYEVEHHHSQSPVSAVDGK